MKDADGHHICISCKKRDQAYRPSKPMKCKACLSDHEQAWRESKSGKASVTASRNKYHRSAKGRETRKAWGTQNPSIVTEARNKWADENRVTRRVLKAHRFDLCENCNMNTDGLGSENCGVAQGDENISLCLVFADWRAYGIHPITGNKRRDF